MSKIDQTSPGATLSAYRRTSLADWCAARGQPYHLLHPGHKKLSAYFDGAKKHWIGRASTFYGRVTDAVLVPPAGLIFTADGAAICGGLSYDDEMRIRALDPTAGARPAPDKLLVRIPTDIPAVDQECIYFGGIHNFGHFIFESLTRLGVAAQIPGAESLPLAVSGGLPKRFYEFLDLAGWPASRRLEIDLTAPTRFARVWHHSAPLRWSDGKVVWSPEDVQFVHERVRASALAKGGGADRRPILFVSRGPQKWRRILNEDEVLACVRQFGGEAISLEGCSAEEQVRSVANARILILPAGASSAISIFAPRDCTILELVTPTITVYFGPLAFAGCLGQPHGRLFGRMATTDETKSAGLEVTTSNPRDGDYWINCQMLADFFRQIGA